MSGTESLAERADDLLDAIPIAGRQVSIDVGRPLSQTNNADLASVYAAEWADSATAGTRADELACKVVKRSVEGSPSGESLGKREQAAYERISHRPPAAKTNIGHFIDEHVSSTHFYFVLTRYRENALSFVSSADDKDERIRRVARFLSSGYVALRQLRDMGIAMRDVHPLNFMVRKDPQWTDDEPAASTDYDFVAVDFGHAYLGTPSTLNTLQAMAAVQRYNLLRRDQIGVLEAHNGFIDDLFSLAVSAYVLISPDGSLPWVTHDGTRLRFSDPDRSAYIFYETDERRLTARFDVDRAALERNASPALASLLAELLDDQKHADERTAFARERLPVLIDALDPDGPSSRAFPVNETEAPDVPEVPTVAPMTARQRTRNPPYLAELKDFRPPEPEAATVVAGRAVQSGFQRSIVYVTPFVVAALALVAPVVGLIALAESNVAPAGWLVVSIGLLAISALLSVAIVLIFAKELRPVSPVKRGLASALITVGCILVVVYVPTFMVVGEQQLLYVAFTGLSWRFADWGVAPWALAIAVTLTAVCIVLRILGVAPKRLLSTISVLGLIVAVGAVFVFSGSPWNDASQHSAAANCDGKTVDFTLPTSEVCIPASADWSAVNPVVYSNDPFVKAMALPGFDHPPVAEGRSATALDLTAVTCTTAYVSASTGEVFGQTIGVPADLSAADSAISQISSVGADGRTNRVQLGDTSYLQYDGLSRDGSTTTGTTAYVPFSFTVGDAFGSTQGRSFGNTSVVVYVVERGCPSAVQPTITGAVRALLSSMRLTALDRLDLSAIQYNPAALKNVNLQQSGIDIPLVTGTTPSLWDHPVAGVSEGDVLAAGRLNLSTDTNAPTVGISFSTSKPSGYDEAAAQNSEFPGWTMGGPIPLAGNGIEQSYFQTQSANGTDYYVTAVVDIPDPTTYNDQVTSRLRLILSSTTLAGNGSRNKS